MPATSQNGFTLLEVLVALVILGLALVMLNGAISDSLLRAQRISDQARATAVADALLARAGYDFPVHPGIIQGVQDGLPWTLTAVAAPNAGSNIPLAALDLRIFSDSNRLLGDWKTLRVMTP